MSTVDELRDAVMSLAASEHTESSYILEALTEFEKAVRAEAEAERDAARLHLDEIYAHLSALERTLSVEQILLCPTDFCKWRKEPEFTSRAAQLSTPEGRRVADMQLTSRIERLRNLSTVRRRGSPLKEDED